MNIVYFNTSFCEFPSKKRDFDGIYIGRYWIIISLTDRLGGKKGIASKPSNPLFIIPDSHGKTLAKLN